MRNWTDELKARRPVDFRTAAISSDEIRSVELTSYSSILAKFEVGHKN